MPVNRDMLRSVFRDPPAARSTRRSEVNTIVTAAPSPLLPPDSVRNPPPGRKRSTWLSNLPPTATLEIVDQEPAHVSDVVPDSGLAAILVVGDIVDDVDTIKRFMVGFSTLAQVLVASTKPEIVGSTYRTYTDFAKKIGKTDAIHLMSRELVLLLGVEGGRRTATNAIILVHDGALVWTNRSDPRVNAGALDFHGLNAAIERYAPSAQDAAAK